MVTQLTTAYAHTGVALRTRDGSYTSHERASGSLSKLRLAWLPRMAGGETLCLWTRRDTLYS